MNSQERFKDYWEKLNKGICPRCEKPMTLKQKGPCVYANPCDHRLCQGRISSEV